MENSIEFKDQSAYDLQLILVQGAVDLERFKIILSAELKDGFGHKVRYGILGASHFAELKDGGNIILTEILACVPSAQITGKSLHLGPISFLRGGKLELDLESGYKYNFSALFRNFPPEAVESKVYRTTIDDVGSLDNSLKYEFESKPDFAFPPKTVVRARFRDDYFLFDSVHAYPNENIFVVSSSSIRRG